MADYYTNFSVSLPLPKSDELKARIREYVEVHTAASELLNEIVTEGADYDDWTSVYHFNFEAVPRYTVATDATQDEIWVYGDGEGNPEAAADFIQRYLDDFEIEGGVVMTIGWSCSKPRINEAGGSAVLITRHEQVWSNPMDELQTLASESGVEILN